MLGNIGETLSKTMSNTVEAAKTTTQHPFGGAQYYIPRVWTRAFNADMGGVKQEDQRKEWIHGMMNTAATFALLMTKFKDQLPQFAQNGVGAVEGVIPGALTEAWNSNPLLGRLALLCLSPSMAMTEGGLTLVQKGLTEGSAAAGLNFVTNGLKGKFDAAAGTEFGKMALFLISGALLLLQAHRGNNMKIGDADTGIKFGVDNWVVDGIDGLLPSAPSA